MARRRVLYGAALLAAVLFQIYSVSYLAGFLLVLAISLPLLALLLSLPAMLGTDVNVAPEARMVRRAEAARWRIEVKNRSPFPLPRLKMTVSTIQALTGARSTRRIVCKSLVNSETLEHPADTARCGVLVCSLRRIWVYDCLGLFAFPRRNAQAELTILPVWSESAPVPPPDVSAPSPAGPAGVKNSGSPEEYDLRSYRPGDALRTVHWKLSSKRGELIVREGLQPQEQVWRVTFDHFGEADAFERTLDRLYTVCSVLLSRGQRLLIQWAEPVLGTVRSASVSDGASFQAALDALLRDPAPVAGQSIDGCMPEDIPDAGSVRHIHIDAGEGDAPCQS